MQFQPPLNLDFTRVRIEMPPGTTLDADRGQVADRSPTIIKKDPDVDRVFERIFVGTGFLNIVLKKDREGPASSSSASLTPQLGADRRRPGQFPAARAAAAGGGARHHALSSAATIPSCCSTTASKIVDEMSDPAGAPRAARQRRPASGRKSLIKPRFDLAADLGVTTTALSQTIRIATMGDIDQNSAKFSLADRQVPIRVDAAGNARARPGDASRTCRCRPRQRRLACR